MPDSLPGQPEGLRFISGVILVSRQPGRVMAFYRDVLGLPLAEERLDHCGIPLCYPPANLGEQ
jgi:hypothetical protein